LIGRDVELDELQERLLQPACRLLTVLGPGGIGKSRLALEAARGLLDRFANGVFLVSLTPLASTEAFLPSLAEAIGLQLHTPKSAKDQLQDYLRQKELLLILDGCEKLLEIVPLTVKLLQVAPRLRVLATSRVRLNAEGEQVYRLNGLECPDATDPEAAASSPAMRLFASAARRAQPGFVLDAVSLPPIIEICNHLQGMPLGILLAATWVEVLSPAEILEEMRRSLDFLQAEWADLPARQRSIRATFDYSWVLLDESERTAFQGLCIFRGPFTRQAAGQVSGTDVAKLRRLVDKSLVMPHTGEWYTIHPLLREFGFAQLSEKPQSRQAVLRRYSAYYLEKLKDWEAELTSARQLETLALLDTKINDLRPAWGWAAEIQDIAHLADGLDGICLYYELRARFVEGASLCQETVTKLAHGDKPGQKLLLARLAVYESRFSRLLGENSQARQRLQESQSLVNQLAEPDLASAGADTRAVQALIYLEGGEAVFMANFPEAQRHLERSLDLYRQIGDVWRIAGVLTQLGINRFHAGDYLEADRIFNQALELYQGLGAISAIANIQSRIAHNRARLGDIETGLVLLRQVVAISQACGDRPQTLLDLRTLSLAYMWNGFFDEALLTLQQGLDLAYELGNRYETTFIHLCFGLNGHLNANYEMAHRHHAFAIELAQRDGFQREAACSLWSLGCIALVEKSTREAQPLFEESIALYRQIGHQDELGWVLAMHAFCCMAHGDLECSQEELAESLEIAHTIRAYFTSLFALTVGALWLARQGEVERSLEIYTLAARQPVFANSPWFHQLFEKAILSCTQAIPFEQAEAARERGRSREFWPSVEELYRIIRPVE
jgi:predicted ATPase